MMTRYQVEIWHREALQGAEWYSRFGGKQFHFWNRELIRAQRALSEARASEVATSD